MIRAESTADMLESFYPDLGRVETLEPVGEKAWRLRANGAQWLLKLHAQWVGPRLEMLAAAYGAAARQGLAPRLRPVAMGGPFALWGDEVFSLQEFLPGRPPKAPEAAAVARSLGRLHLAFGRVPCAEAQHHMAQSSEPLLECARALGLDDEAEAARAAQDYLRRAPRQLVHGDLHPANAVHDRGKVCFVDLDSAHCGVAAQEAAFAAFRLLGPEARAVSDFLTTYAAQVPAETGVPQELAASLVVHAVLTRLVFILAERERGESRWLCDLDNQREYLARAMQLARETKALQCKAFIFDNATD